MLDLELARTNLEAEINQSRARLVELEEAHAELKKFEGSKLSSVLELLTKFGRRKKGEPKATTPDGALIYDPDRPMTKNIIATINFWGKSVRAQDLVDDFVKKGADTDEARMGQKLAAIAEAGHIRRFAPGVYGPAVAAGNGKPPLKRDDYMALLLTTIRKVLAAAPEPVSTPEITKLVEAQGFPFSKGINRQMAVARRLQGKSPIKGLKAHGIGPHRTYSLKD